MAPQTRFRRRGGTHRVKSEDKTNSKYDEWNYTELVLECKAREVYIKDMKKAQMTRALLNSDIEKERLEREALREVKRKQQDAEDARKKAEAHRRETIAARHRRNEEKREKREKGEDVSEDETDEDMMEAYHRKLMSTEGDDADNMGHLLSDVSWDSTSTDSTATSISQSTISSCKLNLFEWPYNRMPDLSPPQVLRSSSYAQRQKNSATELRPRHIPYAPLKVMTTKSLEKLALPGQRYPPTIDLDYVPVLSQQTRAAARNGILEGVLRNAVIEKASIWAERTHVQGWNGQMFFTLPPRNRTKKLADVYRKHDLENRKLLRVKPTSDTVNEDRERRHKQRRKNKGIKMLEVYEAVECRPTAMCYLPAYLECDPYCRGLGELDPQRALQNLFYVRFPGCDVPHYYFWTHEQDWMDPTVPNPAWHSAYPLYEQQTVKQIASYTDQPSMAQKPQISRKNSAKGHNVAHKGLVRVRKLDIVHPILLDTFPLTFEALLTGVEHDLYANGLQVTLQRYRERWLARRKLQAWKSFSQMLPALYPSGKMPDTPPVHALAPMSIAQKIAISDALHKDEKGVEFKGNEPWTRNDDEFWDVVETEKRVETEDEGESFAKVVKDNGFHKPIFTPTGDELQGKSEDKEQEVLYRRSSLSLRDWLNRIDPLFVPPLPTDTPNYPPLANKSPERIVWEQRFVQHTQREMSLMCPFCPTKWGIMDSKVKISYWKAEHPITDMPTDQNIPFAVPQRGQ